MDVSIIIINYNTQQLTKECIDSVIEKTHDIAYEIILVDNASTDGSKEFFEKDIRIKYIYSNDNLGFGRANNKGVAIAEGRNIFFLNSDTVLKNNAVKILCDYLDNNEDVAICGGNLYDKNNKPTHSYLMHYPSVYYELNCAFLKVPDMIRFGKSREFNYTGKQKEVAYVTGADIMMKRSVIEKYGAFDPHFFMYYEEAEMCYRVKKAGYKIISNPQAEIIHYQGASSTKEISDIKLDSCVTYFRLTSSPKYFFNVMKAFKLRMTMIILFTYFFKHCKFEIHLCSYKKIRSKVEFVKSSFNDNNWSLA